MFPVFLDGSYPATFLCPSKTITDLNIWKGNITQIQLGHDVARGIIFAPSETNPGGADSRPFWWSIEYTGEITALLVHLFGGYCR
jgi:hypothetical protein